MKNIQLWRPGCRRTLACYGILRRGRWCGVGFGEFARTQPPPTKDMPWFTLRQHQVRIAVQPTREQNRNPSPNFGKNASPTTSDPHFQSPNTADPLSARSPPSTSGDASSDSQLPSRHFCPFRPRLQKLATSRSACPAAFQSSSRCKPLIHCP